MARNDAHRRAAAERAAARRERVANTMRPARGKDKEQAPARRGAAGLWRHRDRLAPAGVAAGAWATGAAAHAHQFPPLLAAALTATAAASTWFAAPRVTKLRPVEIRYATTVVAGAGTWTAMAAAAGPEAVFYPWALGTLALGAPWWKHRRVRRRVQVEQTVQAWPSISETAGVDGMRVLASSVVATAHGWHGRYRVEPPMTARDAKDYEKRLTACLAKRTGKALPENAVTLEPDSVLEGNIHVLESDPHAAPQPWNPAAAPGSVTKPFGIGPYADGTEARFQFWVPGDGMQMVLVSGVKGSGKTGLLLLLTSVAVEATDAKVIYCDMKGGQDSRPLAERFARWETTTYGTVLALQWLKDEVDRRGQVVRERIWTPTPDEPAYVLVIDELAELEFAEDAWELIASIARRGRSLGVSVVGATQYPTTPPLNSQAISQLDTRFTFRLGKRRHREVSMIDYGDRNPAEFPADRAGTCYFEGREARDLSLRVRWVSDDQLAIIGSLTDPRLAADTEPARAAPAEDSPAPVEDTVPRGTPEGDPDDLEPVASVPGSELAVDRDDLAHRIEMAEDDAERAMWTALAAPNGVRVKELPALAGRSRAWVYGRLEDWQGDGRVERLRTGVYRAKARELADA